MRPAPSRIIRLATATNRGSSRRAIVSTASAYALSPTRTSSSVALPRVVGVEALLQVPERLGHDPGAHVLFGKARDGPEKRVLEREIRRAAGRLLHLVRPSNHSCAASKVL